MSLVCAVTVTVQYIIAYKPRLVDCNAEKWIQVLFYGHYKAAPRLGCPHSWNVNSQTFVVIVCTGGCNREFYKRPDSGSGRTVAVKVVLAFGISTSVFRGP